MNLLLTLPALLSFLVLAAHFFRGESYILFLASFAMFLLVLLARSRWVLRTAQVVLVLGCIEWVVTTVAIAQNRIEDGRDWKRMAVILLTVASVNLLAAALLNTRRLLARYAPARPAPTPATLAPTPQTPE